MWRDSLLLAIPGNSPPHHSDRTRAAFGASFLLTLCILGIIGLSYSSLHFPRSPPSTSLVLLAEGQAAEYQGASLGIYDMLNTRYIIGSTFLSC